MRGARATPKRGSSARATVITSMKLQEQLAVVGKPCPRSLRETPVGIEPVAWCKDGLEGLGPEVRMLERARRRHVGQVGDDQVERRRHVVEQVAPAYRDSVFEPMTAHVRAGEQGGVATGVRRPHLDVRALARDCDRDRATARADVRDARGDRPAGRRPPRRAARSQGEASSPLPGALSRLRPLKVMCPTFSPCCVAAASYDDWAAAAYLDRAPGRRTGARGPIPGSANGGQTRVPGEAGSLRLGRP